MLESVPQVLTYWQAPSFKMQHPDRPLKSTGVEMYIEQVNKVNFGLQL